MNQLPNYMGVSMLFVTLSVLLVFYQFAGIRWKTHPWIPLVVGILLLMIAYTQTLAINSLSKQNIAKGEEMAVQGRLKDQEKLKTLATAQEYQSKLLEIVTIPLAVSIIAAALFGRVDRAYQARVVEYEDRKYALHAQETDLVEEEKTLLEDLASGVRGQGMIDRYKAILEKRFRLGDEHWYILDDFSDLIQARLVRRVDRLRRRRPQ